jgi:hypothetical protein
LPGQPVDQTDPASEDRVTADYFVIPAPFPCGVALFHCRCGAHAVEYDLKRGVPTGWSTSDEGADLCPHCSAQAAGRTPSSSDA